jgi:ATP-binding cassette subfamily B multidrug efflux pump
VPEHEHDEILGRAYDHLLVRRLWETARPHRLLIAGTLILLPMVAAVELAQPFLVKVAIDDYVLRGDGAGLGAVAGLYAATLVLLFALRTVESYLMSVTGQRVMYDLREALFRHLLRMEARFFDANPVGRLMTRVLSDVEAVSEAFTGGLFAVVADAVTLAGVVAIMLWLDWRLALVTFAIVPAVGWSPPTSGCARATPTGRCAGGWPSSTRSFRSHWRA